MLIQTMFISLEATYKYILIIYGSFPSGSSAQINVFIRLTCFPPLTLFLPFMQAVGSFYCGLLQTLLSYDCAIVGNQNIISCQLKPLQPYYCAIVGNQDILYFCVT